jgi:hypothetical protein
MHFEKALQFNKAKCTWTILGEAAEVIFVAFGWPKESAARSAPCGDHDLDKPCGARRRWA